MSNTLNFWTSGLANFLNVGRNQRESMSGGEPSIPNQGNDPHYWAGHNGVNVRVPYQNVHGISPRDVYQMGHNFGNPMMDYSQYSPSIPNFTTAMYTSISGMKQIVSITDIGNVVAHYYDLGKYVGLGGAIRFFMLCKQIKHSFVNISLSDEKIDIQTYSPPTGQESGFSYPLVIHNNKFYLFGTVPTLRYIARKIGEYGIDAYRDYSVDIFSETLFEWRNMLLLAILEKISESGMFQDTKEEITESSLNSFRTTNFSRNISKIIEETKRASGAQTFDDNYYNSYIKSRRKFFKLVESILVSFSANPFIPSRGEKIALEDAAAEGKDALKPFCNCPSYSELFLFSIIYDDSILIKENSKSQGDDDLSTEKLLKEFPRLNDLFNAIMAYPLITQWYKEMEQSDAEEKGGNDDGTRNKATNTASIGRETSNAAGPRTPKKAQDAGSLFSAPGMTIPLNNEPHTSNTITYRLAPPKSQVIFPNNYSNGQRADVPNVYTRSSSKNPSISTNALNAVRIGNEGSFRPSNSQPSVNVRIANFSQVNNLPHQLGQGQHVSTARQPNSTSGYSSDPRQSAHYPQFAPSTYR